MTATEACLLFRGAYIILLSPLITAICKAGVGYVWTNKQSGYMGVGEIRSPLILPGVLCCAASIK